jgi:hypothetical protein
MKTPQPGSFIPLGLFPHGDLGPFTVYTSNRRKVVFFTRSPPTTPPSWLQRRQRSSWMAAAAEWATMSDAQRTWWQQVAYLNHLKISAYNLFIHSRTSNDPTCLSALKIPGAYP